METAPPCKRKTPESRVNSLRCRLIGPKVQPFPQPRATPANMADAPVRGRTWRTGFSGAGLENLGRMTWLEDLDLSVTGVTDKGLHHLLSLTKLRRLRLMVSGITRVGIRDLAAMHALEDLDLQTGEVTDADLKQLEDLTGLRRLVLSGNQAITDSGLEYLAGLQHLRAIGPRRDRNHGHRAPGTGQAEGTEGDYTGFHFGYQPGPGRPRLAWQPRSHRPAEHTDNRWGPEALGRTERLPQAVAGWDEDQRHGLEGVGLASRPSRDRSVVVPQSAMRGPSFWQVGRQSRSSICPIPGIGDTGLQNLTGMKDLRSLNLDGVAVSDDGLAHLAGLRQLRNVNLSSTADHRPGTGPHGRLGVGGNASAWRVCRSMGPGWQAWRRMRNLEILDLHDNGITDDGLRGLAGLSKLRELNLGDTSIGDAGLVYLAHLPRLETLRLDRTKVAGPGLTRSSRATVVSERSTCRRPASPSRG